MSRKPPPAPPDDDDDLWSAVARSVKPLRTRKKTARPPKKPSREAPPVRPKPSPAAVPQATVETVAPPRGFDKSTETRLKQGRLPIEGRLDLHGMTQEEAWRALSQFLTLADRQGWRTLLVITGKGRLSEGGGVLRRMLPAWLESGPWRGKILACAAAQPRDGGSGAFYIRLRKNPTRN